MAEPTYQNLDDEIKKLKDKHDKLTTKLEKGGLTQKERDSIDESIERIEHDMDAFELRKEIYAVSDKIKENEEKGISNKANHNKMIQLEKKRDEELNWKPKKKKTEVKLMVKGKAWTKEELKKFSKGITEEILKEKAEGIKKKEETKKEKPVEPVKSKDSYEYKGYVISAAKDKSGSIAGYFLMKDGIKVKSANNKNLPKFDEAGAAEGYADGLLVSEPHKEAVAEQKAEEAKEEKAEPKAKTVKYKKFSITPIMDARGKLERYDIYKEDESYFGTNKYLDGTKEMIDKKLAKAKKQEATVIEGKPTKKKAGVKPEKKASEKKPTAETKTTEMSPESTMYRIYKRWTTEQVAGAAKKAKVAVGDDKRAMIAAIIKKVGDDYKKIAELFK